MTLRIYLAFLLSLTALGAEQAWTHLRTENFEIYTTAGEKRGREAILYFEQVHALFAKLFKSSAASKLPVRIIAFRNEKEFAPFRPGQAAAAFYSPGLERDYIVMQSIASEHYPIAVHEYMHRVVHGMGLELPIWLNEGAAELFATLKPVGAKVQMGQMDANRAIVVRTNKMIPFSSFLSVKPDSPYYNEREKAGMFYAQSFVLAHMLYYGEEYRGKFGLLQMNYQKSTDPVEVFQNTYGRSPDAVQKDLANYLRQDRFYYGIVDVKLEKAAEEPEVSDVSEYEAKIMVADLYRVSKNWNESARLYEVASKIAPERADAEEGLGWLELYQNKHDQALTHFAKAIELGSKQPLLYENAAKLSWNDSKRAYQYMKQALALNPDLKDGNFNLGSLALNAQDPKTALEAFNKIKKVAPDRASALFHAKAQAFLVLDSLEEARKNADLAAKYAKTDSEQASARDLLQYLAKREESNQVVTPPAASGAAVTAPAPAEEAAPLAPRAAPKPLIRRSKSGALTNFVCEDGKQPRLQVVDAAGVASVYLIDDPKRIVILNAAGSATHDFNCGPQTNTKIKVGFVDPPAGMTGVDGVVRSLEFLQ